MDDLLAVLTANIPLAVIETDDEKRACEQLLDSAEGLRKPCFKWTISDGLKTLERGFGVIKPPELPNPTHILEHIKKESTAGVYILCDFHPFIEGEHVNVRLIKDIALNFDVIGHVLVFVSHKLEIPPELRPYSQRVRLALPTEPEITKIVREEAQRWTDQRGGKVGVDREALRMLVKTVKGMAHQDVRHLVRTAIFDDGVIDQSDVPAINKAKFELLSMDGILSYEFGVEKMDKVGGLENLKSWLEQRKTSFLSGNTIDSPKGVLMVGVQGAGKSLAAKAVAGMWNLPLLRLDFGALYNKFFGETERNLRQSLAQAEVMEPCVLWIDEIEKGLAVGDSDNGTSKRVLGTLLTWMAERDQKVFMVATSNDISKLPPELLRKGRFDEIFFVDLPDDAARKAIFTIHLNRREISTIDFDMELLVQTSAGFSGAEIEQAIVSAQFAANAQEMHLDDQLVLQQLHLTKPLSVVMGEKIAALRAWAQDRTISA
ncbi:AAA family ATPase [Sessilibacter corallicola]|uniref:AAA family ATPase n=1 Tax=Sessilibacter corallicola TaxID=2904075 RepID=UPI001E3B978D|nr:AAA family ATPase [Sessilibacter corallicola]MCE2028177.1 AAA family ATPase [Sessilibacter corallicola]